MPLRRHIAPVLAFTFMIAGCSSSDSTSPEGRAPSVTRVSLSAPTDTVAVGRNLQLSVSLFDADGQPVSGQAITWSSSAAGIATISSDGVARAVSPGTTNILARSGQASASFTLVVPTPDAGTAPSPAAGLSVFPKVLDVTPGTNAALMIRMTDSTGAMVSNPSLEVQSSDPRVVTVGPRGDFQAVSVGSAMITLTANAMSATVPVTVESLAPADFHFDIRFVGAVDQRVIDATTRAVARWERVLVAAMPAQAVNLRAGACTRGAPAIVTTTTGIIVTVAVDSIDGSARTIGLGGPCAMRSDGTFPAVGEIEIDAADVNMLAESGSLSNVIAHELGHVLGIGTLWTTSRSLLADTTSSDPRFAGSDATRAAATLGFDTRGSTYGVAVENEGASGSRLTHWRESVYMTELMTSVDGPGRTTPLSLISVESLRDLGYEVRDAGADYLTAGTVSSGGIGLPAAASGDVLPPLHPAHAERVQYPRFMLTEGGNAVVIGK